MGQLRIAVGPVVAALDFNDTSGAEIINGYIAAYGGPVDGTNQEKLTWFVAHLGRHVRDVHAGQRAQKAAEDARATAESGADEWN